MDYLWRPSLCIRSLCAADAPAFEAGFAAQGWQKPKEQYERYFEQQQAGEKWVFVAEWDGTVVGYVTLCPKAPCGPFVGVPEIVDFNVLQSFQRRGIGTALLDVAEQMAFSFSPVVTIAVGLHGGYGAAQRMYVKRGYMPDGTGIWYGNRPVAEGADCVNDDQLMLYFSKKAVNC